jgi:hypothetical protein
MIKNQIAQLFREQLRDWDLARSAYQALRQVKTRTLLVDGLPYQVQFNPARITSSAAKVDPQSIRQRPCFLCAAHRPPEQKGVLFDDRYTLLVNPYPIFPRHLTIPALEHTPQRIAGRFPDLLRLARELDDFVLFYNGPQCGASAPDHFHFQAGSKGFLPIQSEPNWNGKALRIESESPHEMLSRLQEAYDALPLPTGGDEPMLNLLAWYESGKWIACLFSRKKHRPDCYFSEGKNNLLISPASVDMAGVFITPLQKDFEKITASDLAGILEEVLWP